jgi:predicted ATP-dependent endonuclease of OLD family
MRLIAFHVQNYKTIVDSGRVEVHSNVTCLLGQNEAGKSSVLQAIWKSRNVANRKFDMLYDYPKHDFTRARGTDPVATTLELELDDEDANAFKAAFGFAAPETITLTTMYSGKATLALDTTFADHDISEARRVAGRLVELPAKPAEDGTDQLASVRQQAQNLVAAISGSNFPAMRQAATAVATAVNVQAAIIGAGASEMLATLQDAAEAQSAAELQAAAVAFLGKRIPVFIYFDEYGILKTRIHLPEYLRKASSKDAEIRTQAALFEWARIMPQEVLDLGRPRQEGEDQEVVDRRKEERRTVLEAASFTLSGDWKEWWPQQREHRLKISADGEDVVLQVADDKNPWNVDFQERSRGFQWFFSFYLTFLVESGKAHQGTILLLDEPGLNLHVTAQQRLLSFFQRVSVKNQVIYTTHSPFMVDPDHLDNVRTVFLRRDEKSGYMHTKVSPTTEPEGDHDTVLPLQAALGYGVAQTLFLGKKTLIVEGITDYWILKTLSAELAKVKRSSLPDDVVVLFAGGTSKMLPLVSLFVRPDDKERRLVVLLDADKAGIEKAATLKRELLKRDEAVVLMSDPDMLALPDVEVEDIMSRAELVAAIQQHKGKFKMTKAKAATAVPFLKEVYRENGWGELTHQEKALVMLALVELWRTGKGPDADTLNNAEKVIEGLKRRFA